MNEWYIEYSMAEHNHLVIVSSPVRSNLDFFRLKSMYINFGFRSWNVWTFHIFHISISVAMIVYMPSFNIHQLQWYAITQDNTPHEKIQTSFKFESAKLINDMPRGIINNYSLTWKLQLVDINRAAKRWDNTAQKDDFNSFSPATPITIFYLGCESGAPNENVVQNHLNIALLNVF